MIDYSVLRTEVIRSYNSLEWGLNSPPKPHAFVSLPTQSDLISELSHELIQYIVSGYVKHVWATGDATIFGTCLVNDISYGLLDKAVTSVLDYAIEVINSIEVPSFKFTGDDSVSNFFDNLLNTQKNEEMIFNENIIVFPMGSEPAIRSELPDGFSREHLQAIARGEGIFNAFEYAQNPTDGILFHSQRRALDIANEYLVNLRLVPRGWVDATYVVQQASTRMQEGEYNLLPETAEYLTRWLRSVMADFIDSDRVNLYVTSRFDTVGQMDGVLDILYDLQHHTYPGSSRDTLDCVQQAWDDVETFFVNVRSRYLNTWFYSCPFRTLYEGPRPLYLATERFEIPTDYEIYMYEDLEPRGSFLRSDPNWVRITFPGDTGENDHQYREGH